MTQPTPVAATDVLGEPYTAETIVLPDDHEGEVVATLVKRPADAPSAQSGPRPEGDGGRRAVLHVHGFADYFFHTEYAEWWTARGYDFYALDLRKYGRSIRPHQTPTYCADLAEYYAEIDEAWRLITERDGHTDVVATAHSTGGLTVSLWADARQPPGLAGVVLNSPWLDLQGSALLRGPVGKRIVAELGARRPMFAIPRRVSGLYTRSLHRDHEGEWDFDLTWKPVTSFPVYAGWLRAIRAGHARLQAGLEVAAPVLVLSSDESGYVTEMGDAVHSTDIVLDVRQIRRWATAIGPHVTYVAVAGARHDVVLSRPDVRKRVYAELDAWVAAYVEGR